MLEKKNHNMDLLLSGIDDYYIDKTLYLDENTCNMALKMSKVRGKSFINKRLLLALYLQQFKQIHLPITISNVTDEKPYLMQLDYKFNFSDSNKLQALGIGCSEIGLDIEKIKDRKNLNALARRVLSSQEIDFLSKSLGVATDFCCLWTIREAVLKTLGIGIAYLDYIYVDLKTDKVIIQSYLRNKSKLKLDNLNSFKVINATLYFNNEAFALSLCTQETLENIYVLNENLNFINIEERNFLSRVKTFTLDFQD